MSDTVYIFVGEGLGVPGLPHRITRAEAEAGGVLKLLEQAIAAQNYRVATPDEPAALEAKLKAPVTEDQPETEVEVSDAE